MKKNEPFITYEKFNGERGTLILDKFNKKEIKKILGLKDKQRLLKISKDIKFLYLKNFNFSTWMSFITMGNITFDSCIFSDDINIVANNVSIYNSCYDIINKSNDQHSLKITANENANIKNLKNRFNNKVNLNIDADKANIDNTRFNSYYINVYKSANIENIKHNSENEKLIVNAKDLMLNNTDISIIKINAKNNILRNLNAGFISYINILDSNNIVIDNCELFSTELDLNASDIIKFNNFKVYNSDKNIKLNSSNIIMDDDSIISTNLIFINSIKYNYSKEIINNKLIQKLINRSIKDDDNIPDKYSWDNIIPNKNTKLIEETNKIYVKNTEYDLEDDTCLLMSNCVFFPDNLQINNGDVVEISNFLYQNTNYFTMYFSDVKDINVILNNDYTKENADNISYRVTRANKFSISNGYAKCLSFIDAKEINLDNIIIYSGIIDLSNFDNLNISNCKFYDVNFITNGKNISFDNCLFSNTNINIKSDNLLKMNNNKFNNNCKVSINNTNINNKNISDIDIIRSQFISFLKGYKELCLRSIEEYKNKLLISEDDKIKECEKQLELSIKNKKNKESKIEEQLYKSKSLVYIKK